MIDLHVHILPGVDDGSPDIEESIALAELAVEGGVHTLVATPHSNQRGSFENYYSDRLQLQFDRLNTEVQRQKIPLTILPGMEIFCTEEVPKRIANGSLIGLNFSNYYLIEFAFDAEPDWMGSCLEEVLALGKIPLVAHPERYYCIQDYPMIVYEWLQMGCRIQTNKGSLLGRFGRHVRRTAHTLLEQDLITCVASDAHSPYTRTTYMADVQSYLEELCGREKTQKLLEKNPACVIHNREIPMHGREPVRRRRFF